MMRRAHLEIGSMAAMALLWACAPAVPSSNRGVSTTGGPGSTVPTTSSVTTESPTSPTSTTSTSPTTAPTETTTTTDCDGVVCGEEAACDAGACVCEPGFYGDPWMGCEVATAHTGFIGSPCSSDGDCGDPASWCQLEADGYLGGHCTQACSEYCPDQAGAPVTYCIEPPELAGGHCVSRSDFGSYPVTYGCRPGYGSVPWERVTGWDTELVCLPAEHSELPLECTSPANLDQSDGCYLAMASFGDPALGAALSALLDGSFTVDDAATFLDLNHSHSQVFLEEELGLTVHGNYSSGHPEPMVGAIVHYTAAQREDGTLRYFVGSDPHASTHWVIGSQRNGLPVQIFSHEDRTWHAGSDYNIDRFGIDFANAGYLEPSGDGFVDYADRSYDLYLPTYGTDAVYAPDGIPGLESKYAAHDWWQPYTAHQLYSFVAIGRALHAVYGLDRGAVERHGDVADSRVDPGPGLPTSWLLDLWFDRTDVATSWIAEFKHDPDWMELHPDAR